MSAPRVSVVVATHNRPDSLRGLVAQLAAQDLAPDAFEVIVIDDGSAEPASAALAGIPLPGTLRCVRRPQGGPGAARHDGACLARGEVLVFVDDDMRLQPDFLAAHLALHGPGRRVVVLGNILSADELRDMPLFERYQARQMDRYRAAAAAGRAPMRGVHLCTGNVSMRRADYLAVGGFNLTLGRSEDRELGVRLEKSGCAFVFGTGAASHHASDHTDPEVWLRRAYLYGRFDTIIGRMHRELDNTHPWRFWSLVNPLSRPLILLAMLVPLVGRRIARASYAVARVLDRCGVERPAVTLTALTYGMEYFRGMREECGSLGDTRAEIRQYTGQAAAAGHGAARGTRHAGEGGVVEAGERSVDASTPVNEERRRGVFARMREAAAAIRADHDATRRQRLKYHGEQISPRRIWVDLFTKVGFQMLAAYRVMRFFHEARVPLLPQLVSRFIRHAYGAEIHWRARIAPGVSIVHGIGLVLSHAAVVGEGCILFQHVTLGENLDAATGRVGAPELGRDVHVGPGATLLGPIHVGDGTKVMAGAALLRTVPPRSLVRMPEAEVAPRAAVRDAGAEGPAHPAVGTIPLAAVARGAVQVA